MAEATAIDLVAAASNGAAAATRPGTVGGGDTGLQLFTDLRTFSQEFESGSERRRVH